MASVLNTNLGLLQNKRSWEDRAKLCSQIGISSLAWMGSCCCEIWRSQRTSFGLLFAILGGVFGWGEVCPSPAALHSSAVPCTLWAPCSAQGIHPLSPGPALPRWIYGPNIWKSPEFRTMTSYFKPFHPLSIQRRGQMLKLLFTPKLECCLL